MARQDNFNKPSLERRTLEGIAVSAYAGSRIPKYAGLIALRGMEAPFIGVSYASDMTMGRKWTMDTYEKVGEFLGNSLSLVIPGLVIYPFIFMFLLILTNGNSALSLMGGLLLVLGIIFVYMTTRLTNTG